MRQLAMCVMVLFAVAANAALTSRATLVGQHPAPGAGSSSVICEYSGVRAKFQILAEHGTCAHHIEVQ